MAEVKDYATLKSGGLIKQRQQDFFSIRLRAPAGFITRAQLAKVGEAADRYGLGHVHLTARQGIEIPWVRLESFEALKAELAEVDVIPAGCGPRVRNVMACPGSAICARGLVDCQGLAKELDGRFFGRELPIKKFKMAVSGCPNSCTTPQVNDVGLVGILEPQLDADLCTGCGLCVDACREGAIDLADGLPQREADKCLLCGDCVSVCPLDAWKAARVGYTLYVGGKVGRHPQFGAKIAEFLTPDSVPDVVEKIVSFVQQHGSPKERFGTMLERVGTSALVEFLNLARSTYGTGRPGRDGSPNLQYLW